MFIAHVALDEPQVSAAAHHARFRAELAGPERAEEVDLQFYCGAALAFVQSADPSHSHGVVGKIAEQSAVQRAHGIRVLGSGIEFDDGVILLE